MESTGAACFQPARYCCRFFAHLYSIKMQIRLKNKRLESVHAEDFACEGNLCVKYLHLYLYC